MLERVMYGDFLPTCTVNIACEWHDTLFNSYQGATAMPNYWKNPDNTPCLHSTILGQYLVIMQYDAIHFNEFRSTFFELSTRGFFGCVNIYHNLLSCGLALILHRQDAFEYSQTHDYSRQEQQIYYSVWHYRLVWEYASSKLYRYNIRTASISNYGNERKA